MRYQHSATAGGTTHGDFAGHGLVFAQQILFPKQRAIFSRIDAQPTIEVPGDDRAGNSRNRLGNAFVAPRRIATDIRCRGGPEYLTICNALRRQGRPGR